METMVQPLHTACPLGILSVAWILERNQEYGAFSYSRSHVPDVIHYIVNQEAHHKKQMFLEEYRSILKAFAIDYDDQYIFKEL